MQGELSPKEIEERAIALFGGEPNRRLSIDSELRFGNHGSISVRLTGERAGAWFSHETGQGGWLQKGGAPAGERRGQRRDRSPEIAPSASRFYEVVPRQLRDLDDPSAHIRAAPFRSNDTTPARQYLLSRGITRAPHSVCAWAGNGIAFIAQSADGSVLAVQVMHLNQNGTKNVEFWSDGVVKRTYCPVRDWHRFAAVRMPGRGEPILCEGPETGLSIWLATGRPVAACLGIAGMRQLCTGKRVTLAGDADRPGSPAAEALERAARSRRERRQTVTVVIPPGETARKVDFNDIHREHGLAAVRALFEGKKKNDGRNSNAYSEKLDEPNGARDSKR